MEIIMSFSQQHKEINRGMCCFSQATLHKLFDRRLNASHAKRRNGETPVFQNEGKMLKEYSGWLSNRRAYFFSFFFFLIFIHFILYVFFFILFSLCNALLLALCCLVFSFAVCCLLLKKKKKSFCTCWFCFSPRAEKRSYTAARHIFVHDAHWLCVHITSKFVPDLSELVSDLPILVSVAKTIHVYADVYIRKNNNNNNNNKTNEKEKEIRVQITTALKNSIAANNNVQIKHDRKRKKVVMQRNDDANFVLTFNAIYLFCSHHYERVVTRLYEYSAFICVFLSFSFSFSFVSFPLHFYLKCLSERYRIRVVCKSKSMLRSMIKCCVIQVHCVLLEKCN